MLVSVAQIHELAFNITLIHMNAFTLIDELGSSGLALGWHRVYKQPSLQVQRVGGI